MEITHIEANGITFLAIKGRLDAESAPEAKEIFEDILGSDQPKLLFDFSTLDYISSAGLRVVLNAVKKVIGKGGNFVLCSLNEIVKEVFDTSSFPITDSVESGIIKLNDFDTLGSSHLNRQSQRPSRSEAVS